jgi:hypothetical protein
MWFQVVLTSAVAGLAQYLAAGLINYLLNRPTCAGDARSATAGRLNERAS